jgi:hypothetical protein
MPAFFTGTSAWVRVSIMLSVAMVMIISYRRAGWMSSPTSILSIVWEADGRWLLSRAGKTWEATLSSNSWMNGPAMLLRWDATEGSNSRATVLLTVADLGTVPFRRLCVRLRIAGARTSRATDSLLA